MSSTNSKTPPPTTEAPQPLTRSLFVLPDYEKRAASLPTMFVLTEDEQGVKEVPVPASVKESGVMPDGFCVDFNMDPDTVVATLAREGITDTSHLEPGALEKMIAILNGPENLRICPKSVYDGKRAFTLALIEQKKEKRQTRRRKQQQSSSGSAVKEKKGKRRTRSHK